MSDLTRIAELPQGIAGLRRRVAEMAASDQSGYSTTLALYQSVIADFDSVSAESEELRGVLDNIVCTAALGGTAIELANIARAGLVLNRHEEIR